MPKPKTAMTYPAVEKMLLGWPGVELSSSYGRPSLKVKGKFFTWVKEDGDSIVIGGINFDERDMLMETQGDVFYITDHYRNSRYVLMRLSKAGPGTVPSITTARNASIRCVIGFSASTVPSVPPIRSTGYTTELANIQTEITISNRYFTSR